MHANGKVQRLGCGEARGREDGKDGSFLSQVWRKMIASWKLRFNDKLDAKGKMSKHTIREYMWSR